MDNFDFHYYLELQFPELNLFFAGKPFKKGLQHLFAHFVFNAISDEAWAIFCQASPDTIYKDEQRQAISSKAKKLTKSLEGYVEIARAAGELGTTEASSQLLAVHIFSMMTGLKSLRHSGLPMLQLQSAIDQSIQDIIAQNS